MRRQTYLATPQSVPAKKWMIVDADGQPLGRLAVEVANVLMGKHRPEYTPHVDCGDYVIVTNAKKVALTGNKAAHKMKQRYTRHAGGLKMQPYGQVREQHPERLIQDAVRRMMPKNRLGRHMLAKLKVYPGAEHPHGHLQPVPLSV